MKYNRDELYNQAKEAIEKNNLFFVQDIIAFVPCGQSTFYDNFPADSEEMETLKRMLDTNKVRTKSSIRAKLFKSNKASELLALYRLIADPDEHRKLNQSYVDHTSKGNEIKEFTVTLVNKQDEG